MVTNIYNRVTLFFITPYVIHFGYITMTGLDGTNEVSGWLVGTRFCTSVPTPAQSGFLKVTAFSCV